MVSYLIELYGGAFPLWLAPLQAVVLPISDRHGEYARKVTEELFGGKLRVKMDDRNEKVNAKIREYQMQKVPYMLVVGDREAQNGTVSVRHRKHGDQGSKPVAEFLAMAQDLERRRVCVE
jgi:threonyl-tRNA synthetase